MVFSFQDKNTGPGAKPSENKELAQKLHKQVTKRFKRRRVYVRFKNNTWAAD